MQPLPMSVAAINRDVDAYLCSHVHLDHIGLGLNGKGCENWIRTFLFTLSTGKTPIIWSSLA